MEAVAQRSVLLGIPVDNLDMGQALGKIFKMVDAYKVDKKKRLVATANVDFMVKAHDRKNKNAANSLLSILRKADMVTADGMPLVWLSQLLGEPLKERVTGADMVPALAEKAAKEGKSIYFFGGADSSARRTAKILKTLHPDLKIAGFSAPMIDMEDEIENMVEIARINVTEPDILLIALGNPKQEFWFNRYEKYMKVPVSIGIGGTFEFISGITSRAPEWMQRTGLEWIFRMATDPGRLVNRYAKGLFSFNRMVMPLLFINSIAKRIKQRNSDVSANDLDTKEDLIDSNRILWDNLKKLVGVTTQLFDAVKPPVLMLDFKNVSALNSEDISTLMTVFLEAGRVNLKVQVINLRFLPRLLLKVYKMDDLLQSNDALMGSEAQLGNV